MLTYAPDFRAATPQRERAFYLIIGIKSTLPAPEGSGALAYGHVGKRVIAAVKQAPLRSIYSVGYY